ncbi:alpha-amylase family glycosyl hydrolase [Dyella subtropica]|uniref:alpha-amylase family glycosyl hydrolase n=1 Tax=Dyella subtropica TaxID=2992127 RepID=UPI0022587592|nr:alpha-amylase family glycosyl hydrolase [Dyella subtropica]
MSPHRSKLLAILFALALGGTLPAALAAEAPPSSPVAASTGSGVWYEIFVRAWYDTNGDGIGDLNGVTAKLDYLQSLGVSGIWLMPINPSPSYHGYDITDYEGINPQYGTMQDFERLVSEAHKRGIQVILDLVINHTSDQHPWFQAALDPSSPYRSWYTWAKPDTDLKAPSAAGSLARHANGKQHYLGDFTGAMPDLNYDSPDVRHEMVKVGQFWLAKSVDGFRLDAARHIYDDLRTDTGKPETVRKNVVWWTEFRHGLQEAKPDVYLVGEVTAASPVALAPYLKPLGSVFDFPLAEQLIASARQERRGALGDLLTSTYKVFREAAGDSFVDAPFLSNHDQERVLSQLGGNPQHMRMAAAMLLTLPGRPYVYYGEEIGMLGRKPDANVREPMRWQRDPQAPGESRWKVSTAKQGSDVSVQAEQDDPASLLNFYRMLIHWRAEVGALRDGDIRVVPASNGHLVAYERKTADSCVLVVHNLSGEPQTFVLDAKDHHAFDTVRLHSRPGVTFTNGKLVLPAYTTVVMQ